MSSYSVDPAKLEGIATTLEGLGAQMSALRKLPEGSAVEFGGGQAAHAVESFYDHWGHGVSVLESSLTGLLAALRNATAEYRQVEAAVVEATHS